MIKPSINSDVAKAIKKNKVNILHKEKLSKIDKLALWITNHVGTMGFFFLFLYGLSSGSDGT